MRKIPKNPFTPERKMAYCNRLMQTGNKMATAQEIGVCYDCVLKHIKSDPVFAEQVEFALELHCEAIDNEVRRRAMQGVEEDVYYQGNVVGTVRKYSDHLLIAYAKSKMDRYKDKPTNVDVNVHQGVLAIPAHTPKTIDVEADKPQLSLEEKKKQETDNWMEKFKQDVPTNE